MRGNKQHIGAAAGQQFKGEPGVRPQPGKRDDAASAALKKIRGRLIAKVEQEVVGRAEVEQRPNQVQGVAFRAGAPRDGGAAGVNANADLFCKGVACCAPTCGHGRSIGPTQRGRRG